jgi:hypothetical protein
MIVRCPACDIYYDDEFRKSICTHATFLANDGQNNFRRYEESWYNIRLPSKNEANEYEEFLNANKVKT